MSAYSLRGLNWFNALSAGGKGVQGGPDALEVVLGLDKAIGSVIDRLQARGLVERQPKTDDRRVWLVAITDAGSGLEKAEPFTDPVIDGKGVRGYGAYAFRTDDKAFADAFNAELAKFALTLEKVCVDTVEAGFMTKDLALLIGPDQPWLSTTGFLDKIDENLQKAMA